MFIIVKYIGKPIDEKFHTLIAAKEVALTKILTIYKIIVSVSGYFHDFIKVGIAAKASLIIAKIMAMTGSLVIAQKIKAMAEKNPHK